MVFFLFSVLCIISAFWLDSPLTEKTYVLPENGQKIGPYEVTDNSAVYEFKLYQDLELNSWSYLTLELLDQDSSYIYGFGKDLWHEDGRDSDGYWRESNLDYNIKCTIDKKGVYYFNVLSELSRENMGTIIRFKVSELRGSSLAFYWQALFSLVIAIIINEINRRTLIGWLSK